MYIHAHTHRYVYMCISVSLYLCIYVHMQIQTYTEDSQEERDFGARNVTVLEGVDGVPLRGCVQGVLLSKALRGEVLGVRVKWFTDSGLGGRLDLKGGCLGHGGRVHVCLE